MIYVGIDPGKKGGWAALDPKRMQVFDWLAADCPQHGYILGKRYRGHHAYWSERMRTGLQDVVRKAAEEGEEVMVIIEQQRTHPKEGRVSAFTPGYGFGLWAGIVSGLGLRWRTVTGSTWTKAVLRDAPGAGKDRSISFVSRMFPAFAEHGLILKRRRNPHDGLCDAVCLALYGAKEYTSPVAGRPQV